MGNYNPMEEKNATGSVKRLLGNFVKLHFVENKGEKKYIDKCSQRVGKS